MCKQIWTYQEHHIGGLIKSPSDANSLPLASRKNNALKRAKNRKRNFTGKAVLIKHLIRKGTGVEVVTVTVPHTHTACGLIMSTLNEVEGCF